MTKLDEKIAEAVDDWNGPLMGEIVDRLRFGAGLTYREIFERVRKVRPELTPEGWETLLEDADRDG